MHPMRQLVNSMFELLEIEKVSHLEAINRLESVQEDCIEIMWDIDKEEECSGNGSNEHLAAKTTSKPPLGREIAVRLSKEMVTSAVNAKRLKT